MLAVGAGCGSRRRLVISHDMSDSTACRASWVNVAKSIARSGVESGCNDEKMGAPPAVRKMHSVASPSGCCRVVEAQLLQQRAPIRVRVRDGSNGAPRSTVILRPLFLITRESQWLLDPGSRLEEVDVEAAGKKGGAAATPPGPAPMIATRSRPRVVSGGAGRPNPPPPPPGRGVCVLWCVSVRRKGKKMFRKGMKKKDVGQRAKGKEERKEMAGRQGGMTVGPERSPGGEIPGFE